MRTLRIFWLILIAGLVFITPGVRAAASTNLVFDAATKFYAAKVNETTAEFDFSVTNKGPIEVTINSVRASCGCTTPKLPPLPWKLVPGESGSFHVTADLRGKLGKFQKSITLDTTDGPKMLLVTVSVPTNSTGGNIGVPGTDARTRNMQLASADRQILFRNDCANCHVKPAVGKRGEELYVAACGICHDADHRAALVPDLHALKQTPTAAYWEAWIKNGKVGSMMPAFSHEQGGPLTDEQITSLVDFLVNKFPQQKGAKPAKPTATAAAARQPAPTIESIVGLPTAPPKPPALPKAVE